MICKEYRLAVVVASPLHAVVGAGAGMSPWLGPGLHLKGDTAPSGLLFVGWRLPSLVQCPSVTLSHHRAFRLPGPVGAGILCQSVRSGARLCRGWVGACVCAVKGASRQPSDELLDSLNSQVSGDDVVSDVPPGPAIKRSAIFCWAWRRWRCVPSKGHTKPVQRRSGGSVCSTCKLLLLY
ncbi:hypothetical protein EVAR_76091_1 [Eumeta japonica]|uniref:Uncharacterized protein n=1 Tax=Eumeta variegata TaxID=151549 RepID=A0A4C1W2Q9_EUMVA|nr:hypothetical protein EVAR_76091_1 [Eumeta japonica]